MSLPGIAASLRVPLTHRDFADSVRFITGHACTDNWSDHDISLLEGI